MQPNELFFRSDVYICYKNLLYFIRDPHSIYSRNWLSDVTNTKDLYALFSTRQNFKVLDVRWFHDRIKLFLLSMVDARDLCWN